LLLQLPGDSSPGCPLHLPCDAGSHPPVPFPFLADRAMPPQVSAAVVPALGSLLPPESHRFIPMIVNDGCKGCGLALPPPPPSPPPPQRR
jgi:hypothetical protein